MSIKVHCASLKCIRGASQPNGYLHGRTRMIVFPPGPLGRVEGGDGIVEGRDGADVRPQSSVTHPLDDLTQWARSDSTTKSTVRPSAGRASSGRDGHQRSSGSNQGCGPLRDVAAEDIENQIDVADVFQGVVLEVDELLRAEVERLLTVGSASGADDVGAGLTCELGAIEPTAPAAPCTRTRCPA